MVIWAKSELPEKMGNVSSAGLTESSAVKGSTPLNLKSSFGANSSFLTRQFVSQYLVVN